MKTSQLPPTGWAYEQGYSRELSIKKISTQGVIGWNGWKSCDLSDSEVARPLTSRSLSQQGLFLAPQPSDSQDEVLIIIVQTSSAGRH